MVASRWTIARTRVFYHQMTSNMQEQQCWCLDVICHILSRALLGSKWGSSTELASPVTLQYNPAMLPVWRKRKFVRFESTHSQICHSLLSYYFPASQQTFTSSKQAWWVRLEICSSPASFQVPAVCVQSPWKQLEPPLQLLPPQLQICWQRTNVPPCLLPARVKRVCRRVHACCLESANASMLAACTC